MLLDEGRGYTIRRVGNRSDKELLPPVFLQDSFVITGLESLPKSVLCELPRTLGVKGPGGS